MERTEADVKSRYQHEQQTFTWHPLAYLTSVSRGTEQPVLKGALTHCGTMLGFHFGPGTCSNAWALAAERPRFCL